MIARVASRLFSLLVRAFPSAHRDAHHDEMLDLFDQRFADTRARDGSVAALRWACAAYIDLATAGLRERHRAASRLAQGMTADIRYALRSLNRSWTFTIVAVLSLAIGLGVNVALLLFLRLTFDPPRAVNARGAVELMRLTDGRALGDRWSWADFDAVRQAHIGLEPSAWIIGSRNLRGDGARDGAAVNVMYVSANYFQVLGIKVAPGRPFVPTDDELSSAYPAIVSYDLWRNRFPADSNIAGRTLTLNRTIYTIVGVAPRGYHGHFTGPATDIWLPLATHSLLGARGRLRHDRNVSPLGVIGRLDANTSIAQANAALAGIMRAQAESSPTTNARRTASVVQYTVQGEGFTGAITYTMVFTLSGLVLFVVCLNVGGMVLVRGAARERELAVRQALGAGRSRLVRFLMAESTIVAMAGGVLGMAAALIPLHVLLSRQNASIPIDVTMTVVTMCVGASFVAALLFGLSPALRFSHPDILRALKNDAGTGDRRTSRVHRIAISVQTALALPLLVVNAMVLDATGLLARGHYGFRPENLAIATIDFDAEGYTAAERQSFLAQVTDALSTLPGVTSVSRSAGVPLDYQSRTRPLSLIGAERRYYVRNTRVTERFFETIGTPILLGRAIDRNDVPGAEPVAVVTQSLAEELWPGVNPLGKRFTYAFDREHFVPLMVVGVAADVVGSSHESEPTNVFVALRQFPTSDVMFEMRTAPDQAGVVAAIQQTFVRLDPRMTAPRVVPLLKLMEPERRELYAMTLFLGGLALLTLFLAAIGIHGVVAFAVTARTREIGVRMAMGASRQRVLTMVLNDAAKLAAPGIVIGTGLAMVVSREMLARWYQYLGRSTLDLRVLGAGVAIAATVVIASTLMPALRAAGVQPMQALRKD
jgi:predicted permease